jgi:hypothetical protein
LLGPFTALPEGDELDTGVWAMDVYTHTLRRSQSNLGRPANNQNAPEELPFLKNPKNNKLKSLETQNA